jgi:hypothetical protein
MGDSRVLRISDNVFNIVAILENPNANGEIYRAQYIFKLYDAFNPTPLMEIEGGTFVPKGANFAIFEGPVSIEGGAVPVRATLEWVPESLVWRRDNTPVVELRVASRTLSGEDSRPRLDAIIENPSLENVSNIEIVALLSDETGSVFAASKTFIDSLSAGGRTPVVFTWPGAFVNRAIDISIIIRILPDRSFVR